MDLSKFETLDTATADIEIIGPGGEYLTYDTGEKDDKGQVIRARSTITICSQDSNYYQRVFKRQVTENGSKLTKRGESKITGDSLEKNKIEILTACTSGWKGWTLQGKPFEYSKHNANYLYTAFPFIREQVDEEIHERGNFVSSE